MGQCGFLAGGFRHKKSLATNAERVMWVRLKKERPQLGRRLCTQRLQEVEQNTVDKYVAVYP